MSTYHVGEKKIIKKDILHCEDEKYRDFDYESANQSMEFLGKHLYEFICEDDDVIPQVFTLLFNYFDENPDYFKLEGIFRKPGNKSLEEEMAKELEDGNYEFLQTVEDPYTVATFIKKVLRQMGEPLCTYSRYEEFKSMGDDLNEDRCIENVKKTLSKLPYRNRETFYALLNFLGHVLIFEEDN